MRLFADRFWLPKAGSTEEEYEDAFSPKVFPRGMQQPEFIVAIADGATETSYSGLWAKLLVRSFAKGELIENQFLEGVSTLQAEWNTHVYRRPLAWYAEEKAKYGAAAAFLGLQLRDLEDEGEGAWRAIAVGDTCLVQTRSEKVIEHFPMEHASEFSNRPFLLSSTAAPEECTRYLSARDGRYGCDDSFYLMTDALAAWFFASEERGETPWSTLRDLATDEGPEFANWIEGLRQRHEMRNDDVTLIRIDITG